MGIDENELSNKDYWIDIPSGTEISVATQERGVRDLQDVCELRNWCDVLDVLDSAVLVLSQLRRRVLGTSPCAFSLNAGEAVELESERLFR
jgi:hypothetical protein